MRVLADAPAKKGWYFHQKTKAAKKKELFLCLLLNWEYKIRIESHDLGKKKKKNYFLWFQKQKKANTSLVLIYRGRLEWKKKKSHCVVTAFDMGRNTTCRDEENGKK